jgi:hypothetical protein
MGQNTDEERTMEKIWLKHYPATVPAEVDLDEFKSIGDLFEKSVKQYGPRARPTSTWTRR